MEGQVFKNIYIMKHLKMYIKKTRINNRGLKKIFYSLFFLTYFDPETLN